LAAASLDVGLQDVLDVGTIRTRQMRMSAALILGARPALPVVPAELEPGSPASPGRREESRLV